MNSDAVEELLGQARAMLRQVQPGGDVEDVLGRAERCLQRAQRMVDSDPAGLQSQQVEIMRLGSTVTSLRSKKQQRGENGEENSETSTSTSSSSSSNTAGASSSPKTATSSSSPASGRSKGTGGRETSSPGPQVRVSAEVSAIVVRVLKSQNHYEALLLDFSKRESISEGDIKKSYRKLALKLHPDKCQHPRAEDAFKKVSVAFACLGEKGARRRYDVSGGTLDDTNPGGFAHSHGHHNHPGFHHPQGSPFMNNGRPLTPEEFIAQIFAQEFGRQRGGGAPFVFQTHRPQRHPQQAEGVGSRIPWFFVIFFVVTFLPAIFGLNRDRTVSYSEEFVLEKTSQTLANGYRVANKLIVGNQGLLSSKGADDDLEIPYWILASTAKRLSEQPSEEPHFKAFVLKSWLNRVSTLCQHERGGGFFSRGSAERPNCELKKRYLQKTRG